MIFKLLPIAFLSFSACSSSALPILDHEPLQVRKAAITDSSIFGSYNFRDSCDFSVFSSAGSCSLVFEDNSRNNYVTLVSEGSITSGAIWSCYQIDFEWLNGGAWCDITFNIYNVYATTFTVRYDFASNLSQITTSYKDVILNFNTPYYLHGVESVAFDTLFTPKNNYLTTTYTGYYNFNLNLSTINNPVTVFGSISFDNRLFKSFTNQNNGAIGGSTNLLFLGYDTLNGGYTYYPYNLPFNDDLVLSQNILFNGSKMSVSTYNNLSNVGVFSYVREPDDSDLEDLLFTIADTPVYFVSQFLSFELFGFNLFVALCGIATIVIVIGIIKKVG